MTTEDSPIQHHFMTDGAGIYKEQFLDMMRDVWLSDPELHRQIVREMRKVQKTYLKSYDEVRRSFYDHGSAGQIDIVIEIDRLTALLEPEPADDEELYDHNVNVIRLATLAAFSVNYAYIERDLAKLPASEMFDLSRYMQ